MQIKMISFHLKINSYIETVKPIFILEFFWTGNTGKELKKYVTAYTNVMNIGVKICIN